jgi:ATP-dependent exoDNAse (exonuclease V) beta subunit
MITVEHPTQNIFLSFYPENHTYIDSNNISYISVGEWYSNYFEKFDADLMAAKCAIKRNTTKEILLDKWKKLGEEAADQGQIVHTMLASKFNNCKYISNDLNKEITSKFEKSVNRVYNGIIKKLDPVFIEKIIFDPNRKIAGTCDGLFITKEKDKYVLLDFKTCKKIEKFNYYNKWGKWPYSTLADCNYNHFCLQLSMYSSILETQGYLNYNIPVIQRIVHVLPDNIISLVAKKLIV